MNDSKGEAGKWLDFLLPQAASMQPGWLQDLVNGEVDLLARIRDSRSARALLTRFANKRHALKVPGRTTLAPHQQWLLLNHSRQRTLAHQLAIDALSDFVRTTVRGSAVAALRKALGEADYGRALRGPGLPVQGLNRAQFERALQRGALSDYLLGVGAALLETTTQGGDPFCHLRMRFAFSPPVWASRPQGLQVDAAALAARIETARQEA